MEAYKWYLYIVQVDQMPSFQSGADALHDLVTDLGFTIMDTHGHEFPHPENAYTLSVILGESHAIIHTVPEDNLVYVDVCTCKSYHSGAEMIDMIEKAFRGTVTWSTETSSPRLPIHSVKSK
jgi:S-adenosylmethionine/arginine decarboxylase-like enzyme